MHKTLSYELRHKILKNNHEKLNSYLKFLTLIPFFYLLFSAAWIISTDWITFNIKELSAYHQQISQYKGLVFVIISFLLFLITLKKVVHRIGFLNTELEKLSFLDQLTETFNRHYAFDEIERLINRSQRQRLSFGILFIDLDNFKLINDTHGHCFGDTVLRKVAGRLISAIKTSDIVARFGGDEFLVILNGITDEDIIRIHDRICYSLNKYFSTKDGNYIHISASIGTAIFPRDGNSLEDLIHHADKNMYISKQTTYTFLKPKTPTLF